MVLMPDQKCWGATYIYLEKCRSGTYIPRRDKHVQWKVWKTYMVFFWCGGTYVERMDKENFHDGRR